MICVYCTALFLKHVTRTPLDLLVFTYNICIYKCTCIYILSLYIFIYVHLYNTQRYFNFKLHRKEHQLKLYAKAHNQCRRFLVEVLIFSNKAGRNIRHIISHAGFLLLLGDRADRSRRKYISGDIDRRRRLSLQGRRLSLDGRRISISGRRVDEVVKAPANVEAGLVIIKSFCR